MNQQITGSAIVDGRRRQLAFGLGTALMGMPYVVRSATRHEPLSLALIELMPWASATPTGEYCGILVEVAKQLSTLSGIALQLQPLPYPRAAMMLQRQQVDLMVALQAERLDRIACRLAPLSSEEIVVVGRPGTVLRTLADLRGKTVGGLRHAEYDTVFAATPEIIKYDTNTYRQSIDMLLAGRLDAVIFIRSALTFTLKSMQLTPAAVGTPLHIGRGTLTLYATHACAVTESASAMRDACKIIYRRHSVKALGELLMRQPI